MYEDLKGQPQQPHASQNPHKTHTVLVVNYLFDVQCMYMLLTPSSVSVCGSTEYQSRGSAILSFFYTLLLRCVYNKLLY